MNKPRIFFFILVIVAAVVAGYLFYNSSIVDQSAERKEEDNLATEVKWNIVEEAIEKQVLTKSKTIDMDNFMSFRNCGFEQEHYYEQINSIDTGKLDNKGLTRMEQSIKDCDRWFEELVNLSAQELSDLKVELKDKKLILKELNVYEHNPDVLKKANQRILSDDPDIAGSSLLYLLSFDYEFLNKIAAGMGVTDTEFLRANINLFGLFSCQKGMDCTASGSLMEGLCSDDESLCGLSYETFLLQKITANQYDDLQHALQVINSIIASEWFEQREFLD